MTAVVVRAAGAGLTSEDLIAWIRDRLPRRVEFVAELPRNATGKLLKRELRKTYSGSASTFTR